MPSLTKLFALAILATAGFAATVEKRHISSRCPEAKLVIDSRIDVGGHQIKYTSHSCGAKPSRGHGLFDYPPLCIIFNTCKKKPTPTPTHSHTPTPTPSPSPPAAPKNVCGASCAISCNNNTGILPPISDDCQTIEDAIQIFQGQQASTFQVDPNHLETLTFGTCSYFFENTGTKQLEYCWSDLSTEGSAAGSACFPPNQFSLSEGLCTASDGTWAVGAAHS